MLKRIPQATSGNHLLVDGCAGLGGHSKAILEAFPTSRLVCIDRDPTVLSCIIGYHEIDASGTSKSTD